MVTTVLVVGGSVGGLSSGLALLKAGFTDVRVFERSPQPLTRGAGVGLDDVAVSILWDLLDGTPSGGAAMLSKLAPMRLIEERQARSGNVLLRRDYPYHSVYWEDVYKLVLEGFKAAGGSITFGAKATSASQVARTGDGEAPAIRLAFDDGTTVEGDLLIAADGPWGAMYPQMRPGGGPPKPMIYRGYTAIRGTLPRSSMTTSAERALMLEFRDLGNCLYFVMGPSGHLILYQLGGGLLNWLMYINQPSPTFGDTAQTTGPPPPQMLQEVLTAAEEHWGPALAWLLRNTPEPFANDIYDRDPLDMLVSGQAVLLGDAAHPITPHVAKGTCLAIHDAHVLGTALKPAAAEPARVPDALAQYERRRLPEVTRTVLVSRHMGRVRNRLAGASMHLADFSNVSPEEYGTMIASSGLDPDTRPLDPVLRAIGSQAPPAGCAGR